VTAKLYKDSSMVECVFNMKNWGEARTVEVGFPVMTFYHWSSKDTYGDDITPFIELYVGAKKIDMKSLYIPKAAKDLQARIKLSERYRDSIFQAAVDSLLKIHGSKNHGYHAAINDFMMNVVHKDKTFQDVMPGLMHILLERKNIPFYVWKVRFKAQENVTIKVRYRVPSGMLYKNSNRYFYYLLSTGAGWYKKIEKATIRARIMDSDIRAIRSVKPSTYRKDLKTKEYIWEFQNIEPIKDDNIYLEYEVLENDKSK